MAVVERLAMWGTSFTKVMPYVSTVERKLKEPCHNCAPPYGFRNDLPLTSNIEEFASKVKEANVSGNLDAPEGGFDAIMQVRRGH